MSRGLTVMYNAWGSVIDDTSLAEELKSSERTDTPKALTTEYVAGPRIRIEETDLVSFQVNIVNKGPLTNLWALVELSFDGETWRPMTAGTALTVTGSAPNQELQSEVLPLIRKFVIPEDGSGFHMNYELRATYARLLLKGDVGGGLVKAFAGI